MARVRWSEYLNVVQNDTREIDFLFNQEDGQTPVDLTGAGGWVSFWYQDQDYHVVRAGIVGGSNGLLTYFPDGSEFPTVGDILFRATALLVHMPGLGTNRAWLRISTPIVRWRVLPTP
jgi:hypothetical protein